MPRQVYCSQCSEDFRASSIFVQRPLLTHCPYCGAPVEPATGRLLDHTLLDPGRDPSPTATPPIHRAA
jgi:NAD-dependent SIR2 family protein deacetylase